MPELRSTFEERTHVINPQAWETAVYESEALSKVLVVKVRDLRILNYDQPWEVGDQFLLEDAEQLRPYPVSEPCVPKHCQTGLSREEPFVKKGPLTPQLGLKRGEPTRATWCTA